MPENSLGCTYFFNRASSLHSTRKPYKNQRFIAIAHLCDRLLFDCGETLSVFETITLGRVAGRYSGNASPKELGIISKCASRVGLSMGDVSHV